MKTEPVNKVFRAEKTTKNRDDFKVLMVGLLLGITLLLMLPLVHRWYDTLIIERPFIRATVEIVQTDDYDRPMILYDADATKTVEATWTAIIRDGKSQRLETRRGGGDYTDAEDNPRLWTWKAWFDNGDGSPPPTVPKHPFKVCVSYVSVTVDTQVLDESPEVCSAVFHPERPFTGIVENIDEDLPR